MAALVIGAVTFFLNRRASRAQRACLGVLSGYLFLVYSSTVFTRGSVSKNIEWMPFWSYRRIFLSHDKLLLTEDLLNVLMMLPVGLLLPAAESRCRLRKAVLFVLLVELSIEALQFFTKRGLAEWDDIFHGVAGGVLGYCLCRGLCRVAEGCKRNGGTGA